MNPILHRHQPARWCSYLLFCLALLGMSRVNAQIADSRGKDFWLMFNDNISTPTLTLFIASSVNTSGKVTIPGLGFSADFTVTANTITPVEVPTAASQHTSDVVDNKGIHVTAKNEVTVYGLNYAPFTTDAYLGLPTDVLGNEYIVLTYSGQNRSQFGIVATADGTTVTIVPTANSGSRTAGVSYSISMDEGETYQLDFATDLSGTTIKSNKPIGVMGSNGCANIPPGAVFCDHINEMLPPVTAWGKKFGTVTLKSRSNGDTWRMLAAENNTVIKINGVAEPAVDKGQWVEKILTASSIIEANKPILVAQYSNGSGFSGNPGDPFMMLIPPLEQFLGNYTVTTVSGYVKHYINVVAPNAVVGSLVLDGSAVPASAFTSIGSSGFSGAQIEVEPGIHNLSAGRPFGVFQYGFNDDDSYGYPGGQSFAPVAAAETISISPKEGSAAVGTEQCFEVAVKDQNNAPLAGIRVDFAYSGANTGSAFSFTNEDGIAKFCYTGVTAGKDNIKATGSDLTTNTTFTWNPLGDVFYSKPSGNLHNVATWGINPDGSGTNPANFGAGKTFNLANRSVNYDLTADWTVGGVLNIPSGSQLRIGSHTLSIASITGSGNLHGTASSKLTVTGGPISLKFASGNNKLANMLINSSAAASLSNALEVYSVLQVQSGTLNTGGHLVLKSTATGTARVAPVAGTINGSVTVERYIPAKRAWRLLSAPVSGSQTVSKGWQEGATTASANPNPAPGYGTHITGGPVFGSLANGFDQNHPKTMSSIKKFDNASGTWMPYANTNSTALGNTPVMLFVRGNRGITLGDTSVPANNTTLRAKGTLNTGTQNFSVAASGFTALPNPYASPVDFSKLSKAVIQNNFYVWDPKLGGTYGVGAYVNVSWNGSSYEAMPTPASPISHIIQSGQAFLVRAKSSAGTLAITEADKSASAAANVFGLAANESTVQSMGAARTAPQRGIKVHLQVADAAEGRANLDGIYIAYDSRYKDALDEMDIAKLNNFNENLAISRQGQALLVERRNSATADDQVQLKLWNTTARAYQFSIEPLNFKAAGTFLYLKDHYLNTTTELAADKVSHVPFEVYGDPASASESRFSLLVTGRKLAGSSNGREGFSVWPNPVQGRVISLNLNNQPQGIYQVQLVNSLGQQVYRGQINHSGGTARQEISLRSKLAQGMYLLHITHGNTKASIKLINE